jgi:ubiquinone/menaquinone biosynthesis C-methylase UbiE
MLPLEMIALRALRKRAFGALEGEILELGAGTGVNLPLYSPDARVVVIDLSHPMLKVVPQRATEANIYRVQADVEHLPFPQGTFQTVTGSLVFCSVVNPARGLAEIWRVARDGARLLLVEHTRGDGPGAWLTDLLAPVWLRISDVCHLNRETHHTIAEAGFDVIRLESRVMGIFRLIEAVKNHSRML